MPALAPLQPPLTHHQLRGGLHARNAADFSRKDILSGVLMSTSGDVYGSSFRVSEGAASSAGDLAARVASAGWVAALHDDTSRRLVEIPLTAPAGLALTGAKSEYWT
jgi:hypothetical protein